MPKRPAHCYSKLESRPYVKKKSKSKRDFVRGVPDPKIRAFNMGDRRKTFPVYIHLVAKEAGQIRDIALEAARITANRFLEKKAEGRENYHLKVRVYPHHVLRENKMMAFAGADRLQDGMRRAFGKPIGTAARVRENQQIITVGTYKKYIDVAKEALRRASMKFPMPCTYEIEEKEETADKKNSE
ncbi:MAG: 50S ribosomal protein L16 [Candidatus Odinarchaeia archaeon]